MDTVNNDGKQPQVEKVDSQETNVSETTTNKNPSPSGDVTTNPKVHNSDSNNEVLSRLLKLEEQVKQKDLEINELKAKQSKDEMETQEIQEKLNSEPLDSTDLQQRINKAVNNQEELVSLSSKVNDLANWKMERLKQEQIVALKNKGVSDVQIADAVKILGEQALIDGKINQLFNTKIVNPSASTDSAPTPKPTVDAIPNATTPQVSDDKQTEKQKEIDAKMVNIKTNIIDILNNK